MTASERLRELESAMGPWEQPPDHVLPSIAEPERSAYVFLGALPLIADWTEAAYNGLIEHSAIYDGRDPHCGECGKAVDGEHRPGCYSARAFAALTALREHLDGAVT